MLKINEVLKLFFAATVASSITACCYTKPTDASFRTAPNVRDLLVKPETRISPEYPDHFLACRADVENIDQKEKKRVDNIIDKLKNSKQDVVLYFHGGLSGQKYMVTDLGKKLMNSMFELDQVKKELYPIFLNYDAAPLDTLKDASWSKFKQKIGVILKDKLYQGLEDAIKQEFNYDKVASEDIEKRESEWGAKATNMVFESSGKINRKSLTNFELTEDERIYFETILSENEIPQDLISSNRGGIRKGALVDRIDRLALSLNDLKNTQASDKIQNKSLTSAKSLTVSKLRILRVLARFALRVDHGFFATIQEEVLDELEVDKLGKKHWDTVKVHAKQCFAENSVGRYLVKELIKLKLDRALSINTLSHSAGAIPTAELINYLGDSELKALNAVIMLVPAVNQSTYAQFVIPNKHVYNNLEIYSLTRKKERADKVWKDLLYSSSLLYAVSSLAERSPSLDNMLLIEQHMSPASFPYRYKTYQCIAGEKPLPIWSALKPNDPRSPFITYPFKGNKAPAKGAATHEGTKFPWLSQDLARRYLMTLGVDNADQLVFKLSE